MIGSRLWVYVSLVLIPCVSAGAGESKLFDVPKIDGIVIDGQADDWGDLGLRVDLTPDVTGHIQPRDDHEFRFRLGWDRRGLLMLAKVRDDRFVEADRPGEFWSKDALELHVAAAVGSADNYQIILSAGVSKGRSQVRGQTYDRRKDLPSPYRQPDFTAARTAGTNSYTMEILLPWSNLRIDPRAGREIGFQAVCIDADGKSERRYATWYPATKTSKDSRLMHRLRLAENATAMSSVAAGGHQAGWLPRVRITAPAALAGAAVQVLHAGKVSAEGALAAEDDRSMAELRLPYPPAGSPYGPLKVVMDGKLLATVELPKAKPPRVRLIASPADADGITSVRLRVLSAEDLGGDGRAVVRALNSAGKEIARAECGLGEPAKLALPEGVYILAADVADFHGHALKGGGMCLAGVNPEKTLQDMIGRARKIQADPDRANVAGWFDYLASKLAERFAEGNPRTDDAALRAAMELSDWLTRADAEPDLVKNLRGRLEWAYLARADATGQPFSLWIPDDYDASKIYRLRVMLHGATNTHSPFKAGMNRSHKKDYFQLRVLGRARTAGYGALAETDILEAIEYVKANWNIDPDRVHIFGNSMGGGGSFSLASRYPHLFASAMPMCGFALYTPVENMLHVPVYSLHSRDDPLVIVTRSRAPMRLLEAIGGTVVQEETTGFGHGVGQFTAGVRRAEAWTASFSRAKNVRHIRYTAMDELARRAYWLEVHEWGRAGRPASFEANLTKENILTLKLKNVGALRIDIAASPVDRQKPLSIVVNGDKLDVPGPLGEQFYISRRDDQWKVASDAPVETDYRLHFPGGAMALYHGEPIMIVWGTRGDEATNAAMLSAAQAARKSPWPGWNRASSLGRMLYGRLPGKADVEVTGADMEKYNLVLIGTAAQNAVVAKLAERLPVKFASGRIVSDDGMSWSAEGRAVGLLYYNPLAPRRLIYWAASETPTFYRPDTPLMGIQTWMAVPPDFLVMNVRRIVNVATRRFDSRWRWEAGYSDSPVIPADYCSAEGLNRALAEVVRRQTGADLAMVYCGGPRYALSLAAGETRAMDLLAWEYTRRIAVMELTGREILNYAKAPKTDARGRSRFLPAEKIDTLDPERTYRIAMPAHAISDYGKRTGNNPLSYRLIDATMYDAMKSFSWSAKAKQ